MWYLLIVLISFVFDWFFFFEFHSGEKSSQQFLITKPSDFYPSPAGKTDLIPEPAQCKNKMS